MKKHSPSFGVKLLTVLMIAGIIGGTGYFYKNVQNNAQAVQDGTAENMYFKDTIADERMLGNGSGSGDVSVSDKPQGNENLFMKLSEGKDINIAVIGDSFGYSVGVDSENGWDNVLSKKLTATYGSKVNIINYSIPSTYAYQGYCTVMSKKWSDIDLAILCFGAADQTDVELASFQRNYEATVRALMVKNPYITVMPMISTYVSDSDFSGTIRQTAAHYSLQCLNMNNAFIDSGYTEDELTENGIYPNAKGYTVYGDAIVKQINQTVSDSSSVKNVNVADIKTLYKDVNKMDDYSFIDVKNLKKNSDGNYVITGKTGGIVGVAYTASHSDADTITVYIDGAERNTIACSSKYDSKLTYYSSAAANVSKDSEIQIADNCSNGAKFLGVILSK